MRRGVLLKKMDFLASLFLKVIILIVFLLFSYYQMKLNLFIAVITLLLFSFLNSFFILEWKIKFDMEIFSFQAITVFLFVRRALFYWREVPEEIFTHYDYIVLMFLVVSFLLFIFLKFKNENLFLRKYFYSVFLFLIIVQNILESKYLAIVTLLTSVYNTVFSYYMIDILIVAIVNSFFVKKDKKFIAVYFFIILAVLLRYMTNILWRV